MCNFLSLVSDPSTGDIFYSDWPVRQMFLAHDPRVEILYEKKLRGINEK